MEERKENYQYLLRLYSLVDEYLADTPGKQENLPEVIVAFCVITEKLFKIRLHKENPVLVFENAKFKGDDTLVSIIKEKELDVETIRMRETLNRYKLMFQDEFSDDEIQVLISIYCIRNHFIHGYKPDDKILSDKENIINKMGTVWEKISTQAISIFGKALIKANKPKTKYSEEELEKVLTKEVKTKIEPTKNILGTLTFSDDINHVSEYNRFSIGLVGEKCPRCGSYGFSLDEPNLDIYSTVTFSLCNPSTTYSDLYKCKKCGLELTKKEYEIAKKIKHECD